MTIDQIPQEHQDLINRLFQPGSDILANMSDRKMSLLHAAVGISGEVAELEKACLAIRQLGLYGDGIDLWWQSDPSAPTGPDGKPMSVPLDIDNVLEELGDILFYEGAFRITADLLELPMILHPGFRMWWHTERPPHLAASDKSSRKRVVCDLVSAMSCAAGVLLDATKKHVIYNAALDINRVGAAIESLLNCISQVCEVLGEGFSEEEVRRDNIRKLMLRYPEGYSNQAAQERADKKGGSGE